MKTLLYTGHNDAYKPLAAITVPRMTEYAERHGMDFHCYTEPLVDVPNGIYWTGVCGALKAFEEGHERVVYLDCDQLLTNFDYKLPDWKIGFHASKDWGSDAVEPWHFSMCGFVAHVDSFSLFTKTLSMEPEWRDRPFPEQGPFQEVVRCRVEGTKFVKNQEHFIGMINIHPRRVFNCVPDQVCPGNVPEPWAVGDLAAHITMAHADRRIEIAKEILSRL